MKLLFDQNLSPALVDQLESIFPNSIHVRARGMSEADDEVIWEYAREHGYVLVSKDIDFQQRALLEGPPSKLIWVRLGNCSTAQIAEVLRSRHQQIAEFAEDPLASVLALS